MAAAQARLGKLNIKSIFQPAQQNGYHSHAGVGAMMKNTVGATMTQVPIQAEALEVYAQMGRIQKLKIAKGIWSLTIYNLYAYTNGHNEAEQAAKTDRIIMAVSEDNKADGKPNAMIIGDVNADIEDLPTLMGLVAQESWHDAGSHPSARDPEGNVQMTCRPEGAKASTRRDYAFLNQGAAGHFKGFEVDHDSPYTVHSPITVHFSISKSTPPRQLEVYQPLDTFVRRDEGGKRMLQQLWAVMDHEFKAHEPHLIEAWRNKNAAKIWDLWSKCVEAAFKEQDAPFKRGR